MSCFTIDFKCITNDIVTEAMVLDSVEVTDGKSMPKYAYTDRAAWGSGAEVTIISNEIVKALGLKPVGKAAIAGIGGNQRSNTYEVHLALPNKDVIQDLTVFSGDLDDYDILIGMDVISQLDITITNNPTTVFSFRYPSEGNAEIK